MKKSELLPCPFCGERAVLLQHISNYGNCYYFVTCIDCGNRTEYKKTTQTVMRLWNRRSDNERKKADR